MAQGSSVTITGDSRNDVLTAQAGVDGAGIGGYGQTSLDYNPCGDITINNVTVHAYSAANMTSSPGIGSRESCGTITIDNATVYARGIAQGTTGCPAIGSYSSVPTIVISDSEIHAYRGSFKGTSFADYIGRGGSMGVYQGGQIQCGSGSITGSTVYKYSYDVLTGSSSSDGSETY